MSLEELLLLLLQCATMLLQCCWRGCAGITAVLLRRLMLFDGVNRPALQGMMQLIKRSCSGSGSC
jgi:hypothetical protein